MLCEELAARRAHIDELDVRIVELLNERQAEALAIRSLKETEGLDRFDPVREEQLVSRLVEGSEGPLDEQGVREIYSTILSVSKR